MDNQETGRSNSEKTATETLGILPNGVPNGGVYEHNTLNRDPGHFQPLISNDHIQLPTGAQFGMGHHFVTQFPTYMHTVPAGMYSLNMMEEQGDNSGKRRRRTNYRDPENAAKLTTALGILIKQKEENKPQDLKSIASHFGLPYNTLRDNYLKVTTGRLLKDRGEKRPASTALKTEGEEGVDSKVAKKASVPRSNSSNNSSANNTPRAQSSAPSSSSHQQQVPAYGSSQALNGAQQQPQFSPYPVFHPQMGMHYMPQMHNLQHMQSMQMANGVLQPATIHHPMLTGPPPQMMQMFAPAPLGYQINPANGRPFPVYATAPPHGNGGDLQAQMQAQMQGQMMNPGMLSMTLPNPIHTASNNNSNTTAEGDLSPTGSSSSGNTSAAANHMHLMAPGSMYMAPMQAPGPMFAPGMFAAPHHLMTTDPATGFAQLAPNGLHPMYGNLQNGNLVFNGQDAAAGAAAVVTPSANSASFLAAAMTAAYPEVSAAPTSTSTSAHVATDSENSSADAGPDTASKSAEEVAAKEVLVEGSRQDSHKAEGALATPAAATPAAKRK